MTVHAWTPVVLYPGRPELLCDENGRVLDRPLPAKAPVPGWPKCSRCGCHVAPWKVVLYRLAGESEWTKEEPMCRRITLMPRERALEHLRDRGVEEMREDDPMYAPAIAEMRRSTAAIESGEMDNAITSEEMAARRASST